MPDHEPEATTGGWRVGPRGEVEIIDAPPLLPPRSRSYGIGGFHLSKRGLASLAVAAVTILLVINSSETTTGSGVADSQLPSIPDLSLPPAAALADTRPATLMPTPTLTAGGFVCETTDRGKPNTSKRCSSPSSGFSYWQKDALASGASGDIPANLYLPQAVAVREDLFRTDFPDPHAILGSYGNQSKSGSDQYVKPALIPR